MNSIDQAVMFLLEYVALKQPDAVYAQRASRLMGQLAAVAAEPASALAAKPIIPSAFKTVEDAADVAAAAKKTKN